MAACPLRLLQPLLSWSVMSIEQEGSPRAPLSGSLAEVLQCRGFKQGRMAGLLLCSMEPWPQTWSASLYPQEQRSRRPFTLFILPQVQTSASLHLGGRIPRRLQAGKELTSAVAVPLQALPKSTALQQQARACLCTWGSERLARWWKSLRPQRLLGGA